MNIRKANRNDMDNLIQIRLEYLSSDENVILHQDHIEIIKNQLRDYYQFHLNKDLIIYIAEDRAIVSSVFLVIIEKPANHNFLTGKIGEILNVYTKQEYRRQGLAGKLLELALEEAKRQNLSFVELKASKMGKPLYHKLGFQETESHYTQMKYFMK